MVEMVQGILSWPRPTAQATLQQLSTIEAHMAWCRAAMLRWAAPIRITVLRELICSNISSQICRTTILVATRWRWKSPLNACKQQSTLLTRQWQLMLPLKLSRWRTPTRRSTQASKRSHSPSMISIGRVPSSRDLTKKWSLSQLLLIVSMCSKIISKMTSILSTRRWAKVIWVSANATTSMTYMVSRAKCRWSIVQNNLPRTKLSPPSTAISSLHSCQSNKMSWWKRKKNWTTPTTKMPVFSLR